MTISELDTEQEPGPGRPVTRADATVQRALGRMLTRTHSTPTRDEQLRARQTAILTEEREQQMLRRAVIGS